MALSAGKTALYQFSRYTQMTAGSSSFRRGLHIELGAREKALLADDPSLRRFKSNSKSVRALRRVGDALTLVVVAGCCYEIYVKAFAREDTQNASESA